MSSYDPFKDPRDFASQLLQDWLNQYASLYRDTPSAAAQLKLKPDAYEMVPVPRSIFAETIGKRAKEG